jgi:hypothetical protein
MVEHKSLRGKNPAVEPWLELMFAGVIDAGGDRSE